MPNILHGRLNLNYTPSPATLPSVTSVQNGDTRVYWAGDQEVQATCFMFQLDGDSGSSTINEALTEYTPPTNWPVVNTLMRRPMVVRVFGVTAASDFLREHYADTPNLFVQSINLDNYPEGSPVVNAWYYLAPCATPRHEDWEGPWLDTRVLNIVFWDQSFFLFSNEDAVYECEELDESTIDDPLDTITVEHGFSPGALETISGLTSEINDVRDACLPIIRKFAQSGTWLFLDTSEINEARQNADIGLANATELGEQLIFQCQINESDAVAAYFPGDMDQWVTGGGQLTDLSGDGFVFQGTMFIAEEGRTDENGDPVTDHYSADYTLQSLPALIDAFFEL